MFLTFIFQTPLLISIIVGLSALAVEAYGITLVGLSVRRPIRSSHHMLRSPHQISMIFCTKLHLDEFKKMFQADFWKNRRFRDLGQKWPILAILAIFSQKIRFLDIFLESAHQICLKLGQKLGTVALNHLMAVLCLGKFLFWTFWPFLGQKYIACGDIIFFWLKMAFWAYIFETAHQILMIFSQILDIIVLNNLGSVLCARKFSFAPQGGFTPQNGPF